MRKFHASSGISTGQQRQALSTRTLRFIMAQVLVLSIGQSPTGECLAANTGAVYGSSNDVFFSNVPADGVSYTNYLDTVNVGDGSAGITAVNQGVIGINLARTGVYGTSSSVDVKFDNIIKWDTDNDNTTELVDVLSIDGESPYLVNGVEGNFIIVQSYDDKNKPSTFSIGIDSTIYSGTDVIQFLEKNTGMGAVISGGLTVNNYATVNTENADGIAVSSTGGYGGKGGYFSIGFWSWGYKGGSGGSAGSIVVNNNAKIIVNGIAEEKYGIKAISQGGNGGDGGGPWGLAGSTAGAGGNGGNSGEVWVMLGDASDITTIWEKGYGVFAQSQGGDGGHGGDVASWGYTLGSNGGNGGNAGPVTVYNNGKIHTDGLNSHGIYAKSVGAGAGSGNSISGIRAVGGSGGWASFGNEVVVNNSGTIMTENADSFGILAQSIGGGGGDGGRAGGLFTVGGNGSSGGGSGEVSVYDSGTVTTKGDRSSAIFAQSVGGGGGNGGDAVSVSSKLSVSVGGNGAVGGDGGKVTVIADGSDIDTGLKSKDQHGQDIVDGDESSGILAQSIGGGGGNGGLAISGAISVADLISVSVALGGKGAKGGHAGEMVSVTTTSTTDINIVGNNAQGISAQSIGGGGGNGGASFAVSGGGVINASVSLGGSGAEGGDGKSVQIDNAGSITTGGDLSAGIQAQSIGGGGGNGGLSGAFAVGAGSISVTLGGEAGTGGKSGSVDVTNSGKITTHGENAVGIQAQSIGGGGGNGGAALSGTGGVLAISTAIGGKGGNGKDSDDVTVMNSGDILTDGGLSYGIYAQSVGGGGGNGGFALSGALAVSVEGIPAGAAAISIGGSGGGASNGGNVTVEVNDGDIETQGAGSHAVYAQSVGGGGGTGGFAGSLALALGDGASLGLAIGGSGGSGGSAGEVHVNSDGTAITTHQDGADGIHAQSVGGSGGDGGFAFSGTAAFGAKNLGFSVAIGGGGENGGQGNIVDVANSAMISTYGDHANGLFAQSIGGGGGNGGFSVAGNVTGSVSFGVNVGVAVGGEGGAGGASKLVVVDNNGDISTSGEFSHAIMAQSVGGGGGNGGMSITAGLSAAPSKSLNATVTVGGPGGQGGVGGDVYVGYEAFEPGELTLEKKATSGILKTNGDNADGIFAQSVGGSGGQGGSSLACTFTNDGGKATSVTSTLTFGGSGGQGNVGGNVYVESDSDIMTTGDSSNGIQAQSIGGGGGIGGSAQAINLTTSGLLPLADFEGTNYALALNVGGSGGYGNSGGKVTVVNLGSIETSGVLSRGISAQSVGGGGGSVAEGILGDAGDWIDGAQNILSGLGTAKSIADSFKEKSVEGLIPNSLTLTIGGNGGNNGNADAVSITNDGAIITHGLESHAIFAQSIGGGGGEAQVYAKGTGEGEDVGVGVGLIGEFAIGGAGGAAGNGSTVDIANRGRIEVWGEAADGIYAQSIGGGGGQAGDVYGGFSVTSKDTTITEKISTIGLGVGFGRDGGSGGNGGDVTVKNSGNIVTHGISGIGIFAQSVGGGGGILGDVDGIAFAGSVGGYGKGSKVSINQNGDISTFGKSAHGIFAQSCGGYTDNTPMVYAVPENLTQPLPVSPRYEGRGDSVNVMLSGAIDTHGEDSIGILVQSIGGAGNGNLTVNLSSGLVNGGSGVGSGICFVDGATNTLNNGGTILARSGMAVVGGEGNETINNTGIITGNVDLGYGTNAVNNKYGGTLYSGALIYLGSGTGNTFTNVGTFSPGGQHTFQTTTLTGNLVQNGSGSLQMDIDRSGNHDKLVVASGSAALGGALSVTKGSGPYINGTTYDLLETTDDVISGTFSSTSLPEPKPLLSFLLNQSSSQVELEVAARKFTTAATNSTENSVADYLDRIMPTASGDLNDVLGVVQELSLSQLGRAFSSLSPATYDGLTRTAMAGMFQNHNSLRQRLNNVRAFSFASTYGGDSKPVLLAYNGSDAYLGRFMAGDQGRRAVKRNDFWLDGYSQWGNQRGSDGISGYDYNIYGSTFGYDYCFEDSALLGLSIGFSNASVDFDNNLGKGDIRGYIGSVYGSYFPGDAFFEASFSYGNERFHNNRNLVVGSILREASSAHDGNVYALYFGGGYNFNMNDVIVTPFGAFNYVHLDEESFTETGADNLALLVDGRSTESFISELGVRAGYEHRCKDASFIPQISAAINYDFNAGDRIITSSFAGSQGSMFSIAGQDSGRLGAEVTASLTYVHKNGFSTSLKYSGDFRDRHSSSGIMGEIRYMF